VSLTFLLVFTTPLSASERTFAEAELLELTRLASELSVTVDEIMNFETNLRAAFDISNEKVYFAQRDNFDTLSDIEVQVSENLFLTVTNTIEYGEADFFVVCDSRPSSAWIDFTVTSTATIRSVVGITLVEMRTFHRFFQMHGLPASPVDARGALSTGLGYGTSTHSSLTGMSGNTAFARTTFNIVYAIGISPINMIIQTSQINAITNVPQFHGPGGVHSIWTSWQ